jgi:hypothetical protein
MPRGNSLLAFVRGNAREAALLLLPLWVFCATLTGCATPQQESARQQARYSAAKALFDQTTHDYHLPSAGVSVPKRSELLNLAAAGYARLLHAYPDQPYWCAQAMRSLGNVRAEQGRLDEAIRLYAQVGKQYPAQDWEVLQSWKSAADLLWDAGRQSEARVFDQRIVDRFDTPNSPSVYQIIVRAAKGRLKPS